MPDDRCVITEIRWKRVCTKWRNSFSKQFSKFEIPVTTKLLQTEYKSVYYYYLLCCSTNYAKNVLGNILFFSNYNYFDKRVL